MDNTNGIPLVWDTQGDDALLGSLFPQQDTSNQNFGNLPQNNSTYESPFGEDSVFFTPQCDYDDDFYDGGINYELLAKDLYEKAGTTKGLFFDYEKYKTPNKEVPSPHPVPFVGVVYESVKNPKPFTYKNGQNETVSVIFEDGELNKVKCYVRRNYSFGIYFNKYKVTYAINFKYDGTDDKMYQDSQTLSTSNPYDVKLNDKYKAIMLKTINANTFVEFLAKVRGDNERVHIQKRITEYFDEFFAIAGDDPDKLDGLYEYIPDFVLSQRSDDKLWKDLKILSDASINESGTNENIAIINLLKGVKNKKWWYEQINRNPEPVRKILENLSEDYLFNLIPLFSSIGYGVWTNNDINGAWPYYASPKKVRSDYQRSEGNFTIAVSFSYYIESEKKYKVGVENFWHTSEPDMLVTGLSEGARGPDALQLPFAPMILLLEDGTSFHIPAFVAEYFTKKGIEEPITILLQNLVPLLLPEMNLAKTRSLFPAAKATTGKSVGNLDEISLSWMASRKIGNLGGRLLKTTQIRKLRGILKEKGILLIVEGDKKGITKLFKPLGGFKTIDELFFSMKAKGFVGGFNAETRQLFLSKNATEIVAFHEMAHLTQFEELGNAYLFLNKLEKETYVWEQILANKGRWTKTELKGSLDYINWIRTEEYGLKPLIIK